MGQPVRDLELAMLYITIKLPLRPPGYTPSAADSIYRDPHTNEIQHYIVHGTYGSGPEDFEWGIYIHHGEKNGAVGKWYTLQRLNPYDDHRNTEYALQAQAMPHSPRLLHDVVGLIRVMHATIPMAHKICEHLNQMAPKYITRVYRSYFWATTVYIRLRKDIAKKLQVLDAAVEQFDFETFLREALDFAKVHMPYAAKGQLPRPIIASHFEIDMGMLPTHHASTPEERAERNAKPEDRPSLSKSKEWEASDRFWSSNPL